MLMKEYLPKIGGLFLDETRRGTSVYNSLKNPDFVDKSVQSLIKIGLGKRDINKRDTISVKKYGCLLYRNVQARKNTLNTCECVLTQYQLLNVTKYNIDKHRKLY